MKILVLGCNGMAGHLISLYFKEQGHEVVGFARSISKLLDFTIVGDASDMILIKNIIKEGNFVGCPVRCSEKQMLKSPIKLQN